MSGAEDRARDGPAEDPFAAAARAGVHRISLQTPFAIGRVNCYLIEDEPLTLVDVGPNSARALDELSDGLDALGHAVSEIERIVITHQHVDHLGLLETLSHHSGAEVAAFALLGPYLADFSASAIADDEFSMALMLQHGVPEDLVTALGSVGAAFHAFGSGGDVSRPLRDGDELAFADRSWRVRFRPGHSPSDLIFVDEQRQIMLSGDHLLSRISSNPVISRPLTGPMPDVADPAQRPHALIDYIASMRATRELPAELVLGGHGPPVEDHVALIDERLALHERRARKLHSLLAAGPRTVHELATTMWGNVAVTQAFLTLSEVLGHLDLLIAEGRVAEEVDGPVTRFAAI